MAIKTLEEIMESVRGRVGDSTDDEALSFIEDIQDTITDLSTKANNNEATMWKQKYEENDASWRKRYSDRFFSGGDDEDDFIEPPQNEPKYKTFDDLFKEV